MKFILFAKIFSSKMSLSSSEDIEALTTGCSKYSFSKTTSAFLSPDLITANPAVSALKYGLPKKNVSDVNLTASANAPMVFT